jgi:hypothetical protein
VVTGAVLNVEVSAGAEVVTATGVEEVAATGGVVEGAPGRTRVTPYWAHSAVAA